MICLRLFTALLKEWHEDWAYGRIKVITRRRCLLLLSQQPCYFHDIHLSNLPVSFIRSNPDNGPVAILSIVHMSKVAYRSINCPAGFNTIFVVLPGKYIMNLKNIHIIYFCTGSSRFSISSPFRCSIYV